MDWFVKKHNCIINTLVINFVGTNPQTSSPHYFHLIKSTFPSLVPSTRLTYPMEDKVPPWVRSVRSYFTEAMRHSLSTLSNEFLWAVTEFTLHIQQYRAHEKSIHIRFDIKLLILFVWLYSETVISHWYKQRWICVIMRSDCNISVLNTIVLMTIAVQNVLCDMKATACWVEYININHYVAANEVYS